MTKLLMLGGGHSHAIALDYLARHPIPDVQAQIIHPGTHALYSGMIPGYLSGHYSREDCQIDLQHLTQRSGAALIQTEAIALDLGQQRVICKTGEAIGFDLLSINTGSLPLLPPGVELGDRILAMKPLGKFLDQWRCIEANSESRGQSIAIVGAGLGGIEVALNLNARLAQSLEICLFSQSATVAPKASRSLQQFLTETLALRKITVKVNAKVINAIEHNNSVTLTYGKSLTNEVAQNWIAQTFDAVIFVTQATAPEWVRQSGLATDDRGFIAVEPTLRSTSHSPIFAAGDIASITGSSVPKSGVFAVRQGRPLAQNLGRAALHRPLLGDRSGRETHPNALNLLNLGDNRAVGSYGKLSMTAPIVQPLLWMLKDHIDRRFIRRISSVLGENLIAD